MFDRKIIENNTVILPRLDGRGIFVSNGLILTAAHCVSFETTGQMTLGDYCVELVETRYGSCLAQVCAVEPMNDIAVLWSIDEQAAYDDALKYEEISEKMHPIRLGLLEHQNPESWKTDTPVFIFGKNDVWKDATAHIGRNLGGKCGFSSTQRIIGGDSGGPVINANGELVGLVSNSSTTAKSGAVEDSGSMFAYPSGALPVWVINELKKAFT